MKTSDLGVIISRGGREVKGCVSEKYKLYYFILYLESEIHINVYIYVFHIHIHKTEDVICHDSIL